MSAASGRTGFKIDNVYASNKDNERKTKQPTGQKEEQRNANNRRILPSSEKRPEIAERTFDYRIELQSRQLIKTEARPNVLSQPFYFFAQVQEVKRRETENK